MHDGEESEDDGGEREVDLHGESDGVALRVCLNMPDADAPVQGPGDLADIARVEQVIKTGWSRMCARRRRFRVPAVSVVLLVGCSGVGVNLPPFNGELAVGTWGGDGAGMIVSDTSMHLHVGCTYGDVSGRVAVASGAFDVSGSYMLRAYPITVGPTVPARFTGTVTGNVVTITATVDDTVQHQTVVKGPVIVRLGQAPQLGPCPICRR